jgi:3-phosphoshikimate 1-carboxyvinyltransferase
LRDKESDRLQATLEMLSAAGIDCSSDGKTLSVTGGKIKSCEVKGYADHRIVMSGTVLALAANGAVSVTDTQASRKSYPNFFEEFIELGGIIE